MTEKAWIVYDARYEIAPDAAQVLKLYEEKPTWDQLREDWGGMDAIFVECHVERLHDNKILIDKQILGVIP